MELVDVQFVKTHEDAILPKKNHNEILTGDAGYDLFAVVDVTIPPRESNIVPVGLEVGYITPGYWFRIEARSGLGFKYGLTPHFGVIDCVPKGTLISTPQGNIKVEDLYEGESKPKVISFNEETLQLESDKIEEMWVVENKPLLKITTEGGDEVEIPYTKQVLTKRGWVEAQNLKEGDEILTKYLGE